MIVLVPEVHRNNVKIQMIGDTKKLPKETLEALERAEAMTHPQYRFDPEFRT